MIEINLPIQIRWADLDPNFHVLHSKYYDFGAFFFFFYLTENGISTALLTENNIGPILLKEDCTFRRELKFEDKVSINLKISWYSKNGARWGMQHQIFKNDDILSATINIEGAWMDTQLRKLTAPPEPVISLFENTQKTVDFFVK